MANEKEQTVDEKAKAAAIETNKAAEATQEAKAKQEKQIADAAEAQQIDSIVPKAETVATIDAASQIAVATVAKPQATTDLATGANATQWRIDEHGRRNNPNDVKFQVSYGKTFKGTKVMEDGSIHVVSKETADYFVSQGLGNIVD